MDELVDLIVQPASGNLGARLEPSPARDTVDAVITGINLLADELDVTYQTLEQRVIDRTALLDQARRELERMAFHDALTGLTNRSLLGDRIGQAAARAERGAYPLAWRAGQHIAAGRVGSALGTATYLRAASCREDMARSTGIPPEGSGGPPSASRRR